jgi:hypothetical protein
MLYPTEKLKLPKGEYCIGDPEFMLDANDLSLVYAHLNKKDFQQQYNLNGYSMVLFHTDGLDLYKGKDLANNKFMFPMTSGFICCINIMALKLPPKRIRHCYYVKFKTSFDCYRLSTDRYRSATVEDPKKDIDEDDEDEDDDDDDNDCGNDPGHVIIGEIDIDLNVI